MILSFGLAAAAVVGAETVGAAEQVATATRSANAAAVVRVMSVDELKALRKYCKKRSSREDIRCGQLAKAEAGHGTGPSMSPWLIGIPLAIGGGVAATGGGGPASP